MMLALSVGVAGLLSFTLLSSRGASETKFDPYKLGAPNVDVNATAGKVRQATSAQVSALNQFKTSYSNATVRWNSFAGSPDVMMGFHTGASNDTPENVARTFVAANSTLFGVDPTSPTLVDLKKRWAAILSNSTERRRRGVVNAALVLYEREQRDSHGHGFDLSRCERRFSSVVKRRGGGHERPSRAGQIRSQPFGRN